MLLVSLKVRQLFTKLVEQQLAFVKQIINIQPFAEGLSLIVAISTLVTSKPIIEVKQQAFIEVVQQPITAQSFVVIV